MVVCCYDCYVFLFNETATPEIYTYGHTLSLHDALPISAEYETDEEEGAVGVPVVIRSAQLHNVRLIYREAKKPDRVVQLDQLSIAQGQEELLARSEEHTSELQSLMRLSYAVFCLKKTKKNNIDQSTHQDHKTHIR